MKKALKVVGVLIAGTFVVILGIMIAIINNIEKEDLYDEWNSKY